MYHYGFGVKEERAKAHALYRQSAGLGNLKAREALVTFERFSWPDHDRRTSTPGGSPRT